MAERTTRRRFLQSAAVGGTALGLGSLAFLRRLPPVPAQEAQVSPPLVRLDAGIEPLVRLIEETLQSDLLERVAQRIHQGTSYQQVVAALFLAAVRNVQPRPTVGFKFHAVMVVQAAHMTSLSLPERDRWQPIFWALDEFKNSQAEEQRASGWRMAPVDGRTVPPAPKARQAFIEAMEAWDEKKADGAAAGLVRSARPNEIYEFFYRLGARDFRDIGHKAIFVANSWRTLQFIGWQHAEPVVRSLAFALLHHDLKNTTPALSDDEADRPWRRNQGMAATLGPGWMGGRLDEGATHDMLDVLRTGSNNDACDKAVELIGRGVSPQSIWDAVFVSAGELLMRQPSIVMVHAVDSINALRYGFQATSDEGTKKLLLLQSCAFVPMFRARLNAQAANIRIDDVTPLAIQRQSGAIEEILSDVSTNRMNAARKVRQYLNDGGSVQNLMNAARRLIFLKGDNAHDYKFSAAVLEDYFNVSPAWRDQFLATSVFNLKGSGHRDSSLVERARAALKS
ncbi:MAG: twin-arginine translocation signal domain-containing protein [Acidobacteria bacterium]|nr:twin-arginine translocation signal domain-containing protein [Acidobacteriota bacterium]